CARCPLYDGYYLDYW
nr:immunoglobulin heavy chain junction region [Mus musculus]MBK4197136.1 immunoglobulin heavy chain junction region [Mus musculus]MBK4197137.1 immunoglobulin heavy chain junction region [Mus musculus]MBK4197138.1 immunoglobulin heavy chain junction region [Mus musculus]MBK4197139.1 immunoglobulin heavy chain junction region [Mus musculus]